VSARPPTVVAAVSGRSALAETAWHLQARCKGKSADTFYPPDREKARVRRARELQAKQICLSCPVLEACRRYAVDTHEPHGVWGATTPKDREELLRGGTLVAGGAVDAALGRRARH
jgi:WhiB family transcriptional regulator, redox-sensing transcriptional regulator